MVENRPVDLNVEYDPTTCTLLRRLSTTTEYLLVVLTNLLSKTRHGSTSYRNSTEYLNQDVSFCLPVELAAAHILELHCITHPTHLTLPTPAVFTDFYARMHACIPCMYGGSQPDSERTHPPTQRNVEKYTHRPMNSTAHEHYNRNSPACLPV